MDEPSADALVRDREGALVYDSDGEPMRLWDCNIVSLGLPVMKPDIVFFGQDLPTTFYGVVLPQCWAPGLLAVFAFGCALRAPALANLLDPRCSVDCVQADMEACDLLLAMGSSLQVHPVALVPHLVKEGVPQLLVNREPVEGHEFSTELLGSCDDITRELAHRLGWTLDLGDAQAGPSQTTVAATPPTSAEAAVAALLGEALVSQAGQTVAFRPPHRFLFPDANLARVEKREQRAQLRRDLLAYESPFPTASGPT
jgi:hypothetical protein